MLTNVGNTSVISILLHDLITVPDMTSYDKESFVFFFGLMLNIPVNSYGQVGKVSSPYHTFLFDLFVLFDLILYLPSTIFQLNRDRSSWVEPVLS